MQRPSMPPTKRALIIFLFAMAGSLAGVILGRVLMQQFPDAPPWLLPAIVIGALTLALVAVLSLPAAIRWHRRNQEHPNEP